MTTCLDCRGPIGLRGANAKRCVQCHLRPRPTRPKQANWGVRIARAWPAIVAAHGSCCALCRAPGTEISLTVDHVVPRSAGGANEPSNVQPLCRSCNSAKRAHHPTEK